MKSRASIKSHPIHPILVSFPIAFFTGTFLSDLILVITNRSFFDEMAMYLTIAGIGFAVLAAIPGIIDYYYTVPPESSAKKRATKHALLNGCMLLIFITALLIRNNAIDPLFIMLLEAVGVVLLCIAGWMGGTLVNRNQIGIDHRYAGAGKWREETIHGERRVELNCVSTLGMNQMKLFHINNKRIVVGRTETGLVAFEDFCTHRGGSLADGALICGTVQCPWHGSQFDVHDGTVKAGPAKKPIRTYTIEHIDQQYFLEM